MYRLHVMLKDHSEDLRRKAVHGEKSVPALRQGDDSGTIARKLILAEERGRRRERRRPRIPPAWRLCRFCTDAIETPEHALFECEGSLELQSMRTSFLPRLFGTCPGLRSSLPSYSELLRNASATESCVNLLAKYVFQVMNVFDSVPMYVP